MKKDLEVDYISRGIDKQMTFTAKVGEDVVGVLVVSGFHKYNCEIDSIAIKPAYRNKGIGAKLLELALNAKRINAFVMDVCCSPDQTAFFIKHGFVQVHNYNDVVIRLSRERVKQNPSDDAIAKEMNNFFIKQDPASDKDFFNIWTQEPKENAHD